MQAHALYGPCDGRMFNLRPGQTTLRGLDLERGEIHVYELDNEAGALVYVGCVPEIKYLRARVLELEGHAA